MNLIRWSNLLTALSLTLLATAADAQSKPQPKKKLTGTPPITFYVARGEAGACGPGCSEWIAADGPIDNQATPRLRRLLLRLGATRLPIFFHSNGGSQTQALAIGRLLRKRGMVAGVGRTVPAGCGKLSYGECERLKRSGVVLEAELRSIATCASACVYALIGGVTRRVPPGARVIVHSSRLIQRRADGSVVTLRATDSPRNRKLHAQLNDLLRAYIAEMGIGPGLYGAIMKTPNEMVYRLTRDEIARFGIDTRTFQESPWMRVDIADKEFYVGKFVTKSAGIQHNAFRTSVIQLSCGAPRGVKLTYARGLTEDDVGRPIDLKLSIGSDQIDLSQTGTVKGMGWFETGERFDISSSEVPFDTLSEAATGGSIELAERASDALGAPAQVVKLSTRGLPKASAWLRERCGH